MPNQFPPNQDQPGPDPMTPEVQFALSMKYSSYVLVVLPFRLNDKTFLGLFDAQRNLLEVLDSTPDLDVLYAVSQQAEKIVTEKLYQITKLHNARIDATKQNPPPTKSVSRPILVDLDSISAVEF